MQRNWISLLTVLLICLLLPLATLVKEISTTDVANDGTNRALALPSASERDDTNENDNDNNARVDSETRRTPMAPASDPAFCEGWQTKQDLIEENALPADAYAYADSHAPSSDAAAQNTRSRGMAFTLGSDYPEGRVLSHFYTGGEFRMDTYGGRSLLYPGFSSGGSSFWTFRVDDQNHISRNSAINSYVTQPMSVVPDGSNRNATIEYQFGQIQLELRYELVVNTTKIIMNATNTGSGTHSFGARYLYDTCNGDPGQYDGSPILIPRESDNLTIGHEEEFRQIDQSRYPTTGFKYFSGLDNWPSDNLEFWSTGYLGPDHEATVPDLLRIAWWQQAYDSAWSYAINPSIVFEDLGYPDSCVMAYWEPVDLGAGESHEITTYFGNGIPPFIDYRDIRLALTDPLDIPVRHVPPGGRAQFNLTVTNLGTSRDTIDLSIEDMPLPDGWDAELSVETVTLSSLESYDFHLYVDAPRTNISEGDYVSAMVEAEMREEPEINATVFTQTFIDVSFDFFVEWQAATENFIDHVDEAVIDPGETITVDAVVKNLGNINDSYSLRIEGVPPGWTVVFTNGGSEYNISLPSRLFQPDNDIQISVSITAPVTVEANRKEEFMLIAESQGSGQHKSEEDLLRIIVNPDTGLSMRVSEPKGFVKMGGSVSYDVVVENEGNSLLEVDMSIGGVVNTSGGDNQSWRVELSQESFDLNQGQYITVQVIVHAPDFVYANKKHVIKVEARASANGPNGLFYAHAEPKTLTTTVLPTYRLVPRIETTSAESDVGSMVRFDASVENLGNIPDEVIPRFNDLPIGWNYSFPGYGGTSTFLELSPREGIQLPIAIGVAQNTEMGTYRFSLNLSGKKYDPSITSVFSLSVTVNQHFGITVEPYPQNVTKKAAEPGRHVTFRVRVKNQGNGRDTVTLSTTDILNDNGDLQRRWSVDFLGVLSETIVDQSNLVLHDFDSSIFVYELWDGDRNKYVEPIKYTSMSSSSGDSVELVLASHQYVYVEFGLNSPRDGVTGEYSVGIIGQSSSPSAAVDDDSLFIVELRNADLQVVGDIQIIGEQRAGELLTIITRIKNTGEIDAVNVPVALYVDGEEVTRRTVGAVPLQGENTVSFTYQPTEGTHTLEVRIDPDDTIAEFHEDNNVQSTELSVESPSLFEPGFMASETLFALLGMVLIAVIVGFKRRW